MTKGLGPALHAAQPFFMLRHQPGEEVLLQGVVKPTRKEPGCLLCDLHVDMKEPRCVVLMERWQAKEGPPTLRISVNTGLP